ncbi:MAG: 2-oxo acid dehydrogenase subunit E2 [Alphaproteobacteria bacterium]|nr:2-oxo acid dehydrogenase subunit E2 [Alphaproteobacteria bacterium]
MPIDIVMPQLGETVKEGTITVWRKKIGDRVKADEPLFDVSTDKVETEIPAPADGVLAEILVAEGATVPVGARLAVIASDGRAGATSATPATFSPVSAPTAAAPAIPMPPRAASGPRDRRRRSISPVVRRLAATHGLDLAAIAGTGRDGRIKRDDVRAHLARGAALECSVIPFNRLRRLTAQHMVRSKATSPHVLQAVEAEFHRVDAARRAHQAAWQAREGFELTFLPFIAKAVCTAIAAFPRVNAVIEGENLVVFGRIHLAIAVDLGHEGLVAPVIRDAGSRSVAALARAIRDVAVRARASRLGPDDLAGGTYTISNSGVFGTMITAPIINQPQVAILSTDGICKRPVVVEGPEGDSIAIRPVGVLAQCFDHRAIDGAYSAAFLRTLKDRIETTDWTASID